MGGFAWEINSAHNFNMSDMSFWSVEIPGKGEQTQDIGQSMTLATYLHLTNLALGPSPADGPHTISVVVNGVECVLATLGTGPGMAYQHPLDCLLDSTVTFKNHGKTAIHISGFWTIAEGDEEGGDEGDESESSEEDEELDEQRAAMFAKFQRAAMRVRSV